MDIKNDEYIIVEIIPNALRNGNIVQISALKLKGLTLVDRFDYRLTDNLVGNDYILEMISYDKDSFKYVKSNDTIKNKFKTWIKDLPILIMDNEYTEHYLEYLDNKKESIFNYLNTSYSHNVIDELINEHHLEPSNYIVDLLYEALMAVTN